MRLQWYACAVYSSVVCCGVRGLVIVVIVVSDARWDVKMRNSNEVREIGRYKTVARAESKQSM